MAKRIVWSFTFALILIQVLLFVLNYYLDAGHRWSFVTAVVFAYGIFSMHYLTAWNKSHIRKLFIQTFATILFLLSLDAGLGFHGWSVQYGALAVINLCIGIFAKEGNPLLAWIVLLVTLVLFGVAVLAGSRKAKS